MISTEVDTIFSNLKLDAYCVDIKRIGNSSFYDLRLGNNTPFKKITAALPEIAFRMRSEWTPYMQLLPKEGLVRLQIVRQKNEGFSFWDSSYFFEDESIPIYLGKDSYEEPMVMDLAKNPHILLAGTTGSGKSVALHCFIANLLQLGTVDLYLGDPKNVEFTGYEKLSSVHYLAKSYEDHLSMLDNLVRIMDERFLILEKNGKNNALQMRGMNPIVVIIDEIADLFFQEGRDKFFRARLMRLAAKSRAAGIFFIIATQRPSVSIISGDIKTNFPARISCKVSSKVDSQVVLDESGGETLLGNGDALIKNYKWAEARRFNFPMVRSSEIIERFG